MNQATIRAVAGLWIIVLAAGRSSRLGTAKQLLTFRGGTLLTRTVSLAQRFCGDRVIVVLGADNVRIRSHLRRSSTNARIVLNKRWRDGQGTSLAAGVAALPGRARNVLVLLCDQPDIDAAALRRLLRRWRTGRAVVVASHYGAGNGVPAIFRRAAFRALRSLDADVGARALLNDPASALRVEAVAMPEAARDIDTPADAAGLRGQWP